MDHILGNALFTDKQVEALHAELQDRFPLQVQVNAIYDAMQGRPELLQEVMGYRNYLATTAMRTNTNLIIRADMTVTHPGGQVCQGDTCVYPDCLNRKD